MTKSFKSFGLIAAIALLCASVAIIGCGGSSSGGGAATGVLTTRMPAGTGGASMRGALRGATPPVDIQAYLTLAGKPTAEKKAVLKGSFYEAQFNVPMSDKEQAYKVEFKRVFAAGTKPIPVYKAYGKAKITKAKPAEKVEANLNTTAIAEVAEKYIDDAIIADPTKTRNVSWLADQTEEITEKVNDDKAATDTDVKAVKDKIEAAETAIKTETEKVLKKETKEKDAKKAIEDNKAAKEKAVKEVKDKAEEKNVIEVVEKPADTEPATGQSQGDQSQGDQSQATQPPAPQPTALKLFQLVIVDPTGSTPSTVIYGDVSGDTVSSPKLANRSMGGQDNAAPCSITDGNYTISSIQAIDGQNNLYNLEAKIGDRQVKASDTIEIKNSKISEIITITKKTKYEIRANKEFLLVNSYQNCIILDYIQFGSSDDDLGETRPIFPAFLTVPENGGFALIPADDYSSNCPVMLIRADGVPDASIWGMFFDKLPKVYTTDDAAQLEANTRLKITKSSDLAINQFELCIKKGDNIATKTISFDQGKHETEISLLHDAILRDGGDGDYDIRLGDVVKDTQGNTHGLVDGKVLDFAPTKVTLRNGKFVTNSINITKAEERFVVKNSTGQDLKNVSLWVSSADGKISALPVLSEMKADDLVAINTDGKSLVSQYKLCNALWAEFGAYFLDVYNPTSGAREITALRVVPNHFIIENKTNYDFRYISIRYVSGGEYYSSNTQGDSIFGFAPANGTGYGFFSAKDAASDETQPAPTFACSIASTPTDLDGVTRYPIECLLSTQSESEASQFRYKVTSFTPENATFTLTLPGSGDVYIVDGLTKLTINQAERVEGGIQ